MRNFAMRAAVAAASAIVLGAAGALPAVAADIPVPQGVQPSPPEYYGEPQYAPPPVQGYVYRQPPPVYVYPDPYDYAPPVAVVPGPYYRPYVYGYGYRGPYFARGYGHRHRW